VENKTKKRLVREILRLGKLGRSGAAPLQVNDGGRLDSLNVGTGPLEARGKQNPVLLGGFVAGANFLPAARAPVGLQDFLAEADGFWRDLDELVVGDEFDGLFET
jgi:hypothetical protein